MDARREEREESTNRSRTITTTARRAAAFDPLGNAWFGGRGGPLVQLVNEIDKGKGIHARAVLAADAPVPVHRFLHRDAGQEWRGVGRRDARPRIRALQSEDGTMGRL